MRALRACAIVAGMGMVSLAVGCNRADNFRQEDRHRKLLALAVDQAGQIGAPKDRLQRQLNIAELQIKSGYDAEARASLYMAVQTLQAVNSGQMNNHERLAGWISISELSRWADDDSAARSACAQAVDLLKAVEPVGDRCQFVRGIADELRQLDGKPAAAEVLRLARPWVAAIGPLEEQREARRALAVDLFLYDDYDGGANMLAGDQSPAWRSDTLVELAAQASPVKSNYGLNLSYEATFQQAGFSGQQLVQ